MAEPRGPKSQILQEHRQTRSARCSCKLPSGKDIRRKHLEDQSRSHKGRTLSPVPALQPWPGADRGSAQGERCQGENKLININSPSAPLLRPQRTPPSQRKALCTLRTTQGCPGFLACPPQGGSPCPPCPIPAGQLQACSLCTLRENLGFCCPTLCCPCP